VQQISEDFVYTVFTAVLKALRERLREKD